MIFVGVCGGRDFADYGCVRNAIAELAAREQEELIIIHGNARGADTLADRAAVSLGMHTGRFSAQWSYLGKSAGPRRNAVMAELPLRYLLAFPGGPGTADMVRRCRAKGIEVIEVKE